MQKFAAVSLLLLSLGCSTTSPLRPAFVPPGSPTNPVAPASSRCSADQFDMLDWMTLDDDLRDNTYLHGVRPDNTNANDLYTVVREGKFYWVKSPQGWPWDIELIDDDGIYDWITEYNWTDPYAFKKSHHDTNKKWANRCMKPGERILSPDTSYEINAAQCGNNGNQTIHDLKNMITTVEGLRSINLGGDMPASLEVLVFHYDYVCDENFEHCKDRETYLFNKRYGLVWWEHQTLNPDGNSYAEPDNVTIFNRIQHGSPPLPEFPCF